MIERGTPQNRQIDPLSHILDSDRGFSNNRLAITKRALRLAYNNYVTDEPLSATAVYSLSRLSNKCPGEKPFPFSHRILSTLEIRDAETAKRLKVLKALHLYLEQKSSPEPEKFEAGITALLDSAMSDHKAISKYPEMDIVYSMRKSQKIALTKPRRKSEGLFSTILTRPEDRLTMAQINRQTLSLALFHWNDRATPAQPRQRTLYQPVV